MFLVLSEKEYRAKDGTKIHADVNGAFNIDRKVIPNWTLANLSFDRVRSPVFFPLLRQATLKLQTKSLGAKKPQDNKLINAFKLPEMGR